MADSERISILIVEDEPILAMDLSDSLEDEGYWIVGIATNGRKALELYQRQRVDLLLCDISLKGDWDGIDTSHQLLALRPVPIIYLTALSDHDTLERAKLTYPAAFLNKPYQLKNLRTAIELAIYNFKSRPETPQINPLLEAVASPDKDTTKREALLQIDNYLFVKQNYQFVRVSLEDLLYLEADNIHTVLITSTRKYSLRLSLSSILERINLPGLVRVHRSYAVNVRSVDSFNDAEVSLGKALVPMSRNYREDFLKQFQHR